MKLRKIPILWDCLSSRDPRDPRDPTNPRDPTVGFAGDDDAPNHHRHPRHEMPSVMENDGKVSWKMMGDHGWWCDIFRGSPNKLHENSRNVVGGSWRARGKRQDHWLRSPLGLSKESNLEKRNLECWWLHHPSQDMGRCTLEYTYETGKMVCNWCAFPCLPCAPPQW